MPEILPDHVPSPRTLLAWDGTAYRPVTIDAAGHIQIDVLSTVMDAAAPTLANQALVVAALQNIELLRNALESIATDRLIVRGEDQLFSLRRVIANVRSAVVSGAGGYVDSQPCPDGMYWVITTIAGQDATNPTTWHIHNNRHDGTNVVIYLEERAFGTSSPSVWGGHTFLDKDDVIRVTFGGSLAGDTCEVHLTGHEITWET